MKKFTSLIILKLLLIVVGKVDRSVDQLQCDFGYYYDEAVDRCERCSCETKWDRHRLCLSFCQSKEETTTGKLPSNETNSPVLQGSLGHGEVPVWVKILIATIAAVVIAAVVALVLFLWKHQYKHCDKKGIEESGFPENSQKSTIQPLVCLETDV